MAEELVIELVVREAVYGFVLLKLMLQRILLFLQQEVLEVMDNITGMALGEGTTTLEEVVDAYF